MSELRLVGDIGGTHARLALAEAGQLRADSADSVPTADHDTLQGALRDYLKRDSRLDHAGDITEVRIAIAGPVGSDRIAMTNANWQFSVRELEQQLRGSDLPALRSLRIINDFEAQALALPHLSHDEVVRIGTVGDRPGCKTVLGPGTGFGAACIVPVDERFIVLPGEGGHAGFAPDNAREVALCQWLLEQRLPVTRETLLSGPGLERLHSALGAVDGHPRAHLDAPAVVERALAGDVDCRDTLNVFCSLLGTAARDQALICGARGGVYLSGGIVQHFVDFFLASDFRQRFDTSPAMAPYLREIPTYLVTSPQIGLIGAAHAE